MLSLSLRLCFNDCILDTSKIFADKYRSVFQNGKVWKYLFYLCGIYTICCILCKARQYLNADAVLSPVGFQCPEIS